jgi:hypothetical protein
MLAAVASLALASTAAATEAEASAPQAPPPAAAPAPVPVRVLSGAPQPYGKPSGLFPGVVIGPKLALAPFPSVWGVGLEARILNTFGITLDYSAVPSIKVPNAENADARMEYRDLNAAVRWFPWSERFYLGAAFGTRTFQARATESITGLVGTVEVKSTYVAPELGWRFIWSSGFFMGIDLGWQIITSDTSTFGLPAGMPAQDQQDLKDSAHQFGKTGFPIISLLQLGWYL